MKERILNIPVPKISFLASKKDVNEDPVSPLLLSSPYSETTEQEREQQEKLAQSWKSPSQGSPSEETLRYEKSMKDLEELREQTRVIKASMKEIKRTAIELKERNLQKKKQKLEKKELLERQKKDADSIGTLEIRRTGPPLSISTRERRPGRPLSFFRRESNNIRKMNDKRKLRRMEKQKRFESKLAAIKSAERPAVTLKRESIEDWEEQRTMEVQQQALQIQQGLAVANRFSSLKAAPFPLDKDNENESDADTVLNSESLSDRTSNKVGKASHTTPTPKKRMQVRSPTPPSRLSRGSVSTIISKASRLSEQNPKPLFPHGSPCYGCKQNICPFMRAVATTRAMCIKKFGAETLAQINRNYNSNSHRRKKVYLLYKDHVTLKSIKNIPTCVMLMAMEWFPSSSDNRSISAIRDKYTRASGEKLWSDKVYAKRLLALQNHGNTPVPPTDSDDEWLD